MQNRNRYDSLNVEIQTDTALRRKKPSQLNKTIDVVADSNGKPDSIRIIEEREISMSDPAKDRYFQQLYRKNQQLRRELKSISAKLSEQIDKVRFNPRKSSATAPADNKADKAIKRELENAYKQVAMYKKQLMNLKSKEETEASFDKLKDLQNQIAYKDTEITQLQSQLKSVKAVKQMQQKKLQVDIENQEVQNILKSYGEESKELKNKLKEYAARDRKREENYKKQQAYQVEIEKKLREISDMYHPGVKKEEPQKPSNEAREVSDEEWKIIKSELEYEKNFYKQLHKKIQAMSKTIKNEKVQKEQAEKKLHDTQIKVQSLKTKIAQMKKLVAHQNQMDKASEGEEEQFTVEKNTKKGSKSSPKVEPTYKSTISHKHQAPTGGKWKLQQRMDQKGFANKEDASFNDADICSDKDSKIVGIILQIDQDNQICSMQTLYIVDGRNIEGKRSSEYEGSRLRWELKTGDYVKSISGAFNNKGMLEYLILTSKQGKTGKFGNNNANQKVFNLDIGDDEVPKFIFGSSHRFGKDVRISSFGACIGPDNSDG